MDDATQFELPLDDETKQHIANALWMRFFESENIPDDVGVQIRDSKNRAQSFGTRMGAYLDWLLAHPQSHNPSYELRYTTLKSLCKELTPHQAYVIVNKFLGLNASQGFERLPKTADLKFPRDHLPQLKTQVGWHFFVGSCWDADEREFGIEYMLFRAPLLNPALAAQFNLTDVENQVIELQLGVSEVGDRHYQAEPVVIAGTTGLITCGLAPFHYAVGRNRIESTTTASFFPLHLAAWGVEKHVEAKELEIDLTFTSGKEYLLQGANGCMPCVDGMGTLYYSIPNMEVAPESSIRIGGETITLTRGTFWFDHQWGYLAGNPQSSVLRAANNTKQPEPPGWDWFMAQFNGNRQLTMFAPHTNAYVAFYYQTGAQPPGVMQVSVIGKYMDEQKNLANTVGTLVVSQWVRSAYSPNEDRYPATHTWHPNRWEFTFDEIVPEDIRSFTLVPIVESGQMNYFANGSQYAEGAVYVRTANGGDVGRGFAESVQYADTTDTMLTLAGIMDEQARHVLRNLETSSGLRRIQSLLYVAMHQSDLKRILASQQGLEMFAGLGQSKGHSRH
ncbi:MAG: lipocalin-like domain-containing protein [Halobacteriota archaeon]